MIDGSFRLSYGDELSPCIMFNATASNVREALLSIHSISNVNVLSRPSLNELFPFEYEIMISNGEEVTSSIISVPRTQFGKNSCKAFVGGDPILSKMAMITKTKNGRTVYDSRGIEPDIKVEAGITELKTEGLKKGREENLRGALDKKNSATKTKDNKKSEITPSEKLLQDNQISRAVDLIRGIHLFSNKVKKTSTAFINQSVNINENDTVRNQ